MPVLAKDATQVAPTKEDGAGSTPATEGIFFAMMRSETVDDSELTGTTHSAFDGPETIHMAIAGAQVTIFKMLV